jgi:hypothetical protein
MTDTQFYNTVMTETENLSTPTGDTVEDGWIINVEVHYTTMYVLEVANKKCSHPLQEA